MDVLLIKNGAVDNCISADSVASAQVFYPDCICMERSGAVGPGWLYDGAHFTAPAVVPPAVKTVITRLEFLRRMPFQKRVELRQAASSDPILADAMGMLDMADQVDTRSADAQSMIGYCVQKGYFTVAEAAVILGRK